jgi:hypothetical protein
MVSVLLFYTCAVLAETGAISIEGSQVKKITLQGRRIRGTTSFTDPCGTVQIAPGHYRVTQIELRDGYIATGSNMAPAADNINVEPNKTHLLKLGGPLVQSVEAKRQGRCLELSYHLRGIGGEEYRQERPSGSPAFAIYRGQERLGTGTFAYG